MALSSFHGSDQRMGHCPTCWIGQQLWQCLQMIWLCRGVPSQPGAGWAQAGQAARCCLGVVGQECGHTWLMWASGLVCTSSSHPEPGRSCLDHRLAHTQRAASPAGPTSSHTPGSPQPPGPGKGVMWSWACSPWPTLYWACVWVWDNVGITKGWQRGITEGQLSAHFAGTCREKVCLARVVAAVLPIPGAPM